MTYEAITGIILVLYGFGTSMLGGNSRLCIYDFHVYECTCRIVDVPENTDNRAFLLDNNTNKEKGAILLL